MDALASLLPFLHFSVAISVPWDENYVTVTLNLKRHGKDPGNGNPRWTNQPLQRRHVIELLITKESFIRAAQPLLSSILDIDHLKCNDTYGHQIVMRYCRTVATTMKTYHAQHGISHAMAREFLIVLTQRILKARLSEQNVCEPKSKESCFQTLAPILRLPFPLAFRNIKCGRRWWYYCPCRRSPLPGQKWWQTALNCLVMHTVLNPKQALETDSAVKLRGII